MKKLGLILVLILLFSCNASTNKKSNALIIPENGATYDTTKYNASITPDTSGCSWIADGREIVDTLKNRKCFFKSTSDTFLATANYKRLLTCRIPLFLKIPNDTILVSGYIYRIYSNDGNSGNPTIISEIKYSKK